MIVNPEKIKDETIQNLRDNGYMVIIIEPDDLANIQNVDELEKLATDLVYNLVGEQNID